MKINGTFTRYSKVSAAAGGTIVFLLMILLAGRMGAVGIVIGIPAIIFSVYFIGNVKGRYSADHEKVVIIYKREISVFFFADIIAVNTEYHYLRDSFFRKKAIYGSYLLITDRNGDVHKFTDEIAFPKRTAEESPEEIEEKISKSSFPVLSAYISLLMRMY